MPANARCCQPRDMVGAYKKRPSNADGLSGRVLWRRNQVAQRGEAGTRRNVIAASLTVMC